jgi:uncharacterized protein (TIGR02246 family)
METQLNSFFSSYDAAWNRHDARAFTNLFLENTSAYFFMLDGRKTEMNGRAEMLEFYLASFEGLRERPSVTHNTEIARAQEVCDELSTADGMALITETNAEGKSTTLRSWAVHFLLKKTEDGWRVFSLRASERPIT